jgi:hypothetical protein
VLPWVRHDRLGSMSVTVVPCPSGDGSWFFGGTRMWSRLMEVVESDPLMKPTVNLGMATAAGSLCDCELALVVHAITVYRYHHHHHLDPGETPSLAPCPSHCGHECEIVWELQRASSLNLSVGRIPE